jgi:signal transduction histidine kinase/ligand-binding sensor domain-containing protein
MPFALLLLAGMASFVGQARAQKPVAPIVKTSGAEGERPGPLAVESIAPGFVHRFHPTDTIASIVQDGQGFLWLATDRGLCRFDGTDFQWVDFAEALRGEGTAVALSRHGGVWFARVETPQLVRVAERRIAARVPLPEDDAGLIHDLREDADGVLWIAGDRGLVRWDGQSLRTLGAAEGLVGARATALFLDARDNLWVGTDQGLGRRLGQRFEMVRTGVEITDVTEDGQRRIWAGTRQGGVLTLDHAGARPADAMVSWPVGPEVMALERDRDGHLWAAANPEILRFDGQRYVHALVAEAFDPEVRDIFRDRGGNLWFGTRASGLLRIKAQDSFEIVGAAQGLKGRVPWAVAPRRAGGAWLVTEQGVFRADRNGAVPIEGFGRDERWSLRSIGEHPDGWLWIVDERGSLIRWKDGVFERHPVPGLAPGQILRSVFITRAGAVWFSVDDGILARFDAGRFFFYPPSQHGCAGKIYELCEDPDGGMWFSSEGSGVCVLRDGRFSHFDASAIGGNRVNSVHCGQNGSVWIGTTEVGVVRHRKGRFSGPLNAQGRLKDHVAHILEDGRGHFWISSRDGVQRVPVAAMEALADGARADVHVRSFGVADGLRASSAMWGHEPGGALASDGSVWFPSLGGVLVFPPAAETEPPPYSHVVIDRVVVDGNVIAVSGQDQDLRLAVGTGLIELHFTAPALSDPHRVRYRYRLLGFDADFIDAGPRRTAYYTNLPAGDYRFTVTAYTKESAEIQEASVALAMVPPFYRTTTFSVLMVATLIALVVAGIRVRIWRIRNRFSAIMDERSRIARDMHDTLEQGLVAAKLQIDAARVGFGNTDKAMRNLRRAAELIDRSMREAKGAIWALRSGPFDRLDLKTALSVMLGQALSGTTVGFDLKIAGQPSRLPPETEREIVRIAQETVTNALKHAKPTHIEVKLDFAPGVFRFVCRDDGAGFDVGKAVHDRGGKSSYGLLGMQERAGRLSGQLHIESDPGQGTRVVLQVPVPEERTA